MPHTKIHRRLFRKRSLLAFFFAFLVSGTAALGVLSYLEPVPSPMILKTLNVQNPTAPPDAVAWPEFANASIGTVDHGVLLSKPGEQPLQPTASTAKLITVLTILKAKPLALGEQGPLITMAERDVALYNEYVRLNGSVVAVRTGQQLSEYQMLQGILIRSGNNLADSLAFWAFGGMDEYRKAAAQLVAELGMTSTVIGPDASGYSPMTASTANDLTRLGIAAMKHDVVREIVRQPTFNSPHEGAQPSTNWMLGQNGTVGVKTGYVPAIGGVFIIASELPVEGKEPIVIVGTVQGEVTTYAAILEAGVLAESFKTLFTARTLVPKNTVVATIQTPWGETSDVVASEDLTTFGWKYENIQPDVQIQSNLPFQKGDVVGKVSVGNRSINLIATNTVKQPSWQWRAFRIP